MLVQLEFRNDLNEQHYEKGVSFEVEDKEDCRILKCIANTEHKCWVQAFPHGMKSNVIFKMKELSYGIYSNSNLRNQLKRYFNYELIDGFPQIDLDSGHFYTSEEFIEYVNDEKLSCNKPIPDWSKVVLNYGTADSLEQVLERYKKFIELNDVVIEVSKITKEYDSPEGGFRFNKNGKYIGSHNITNEYFYQEKELEEIILFSLYPVTLLR